jgi:hypothetical protein
MFAFVCSCLNMHIESHIAAQLVYVWECPFFFGWRSSVGGTSFFFFCIHQ